MIHTCPYCLSEQNAVTALMQSGARDLLPEPGDFGLCIDCGEWFAFASAPGGTRALSPDERAETLTDPLLATAKRLTREIKARRLQ